MRVTLWMMAALLALMTVLSGVSCWLCRDSAETFGQEAENMRALLERADWPGLQTALEQVEARWKNREWALQMLIRHRETDDVNAALNKLRAGMDMQDASLCMWALAEFAESCQHLYHRDALTLTNII